MNFFCTTKFLVRDSLKPSMIAIHCPTLHATTHGVMMNIYKKILTINKLSGC